MQHKALKALPTFKTEAEERTFWKTHYATDYLDLSKARRVTFANLKPSTYSIALRLPAHMLEGIKNAANKRGVPYQSLIEVWLQERLEEVLSRAWRAQRVPIRES
jgi:predicted DNA binding CopG/RHH family protein